MSNNLDRYTMPKIKHKEMSPLEAFEIITGQTGNPFATLISSRINGRSEYAQAYKVLYKLINKYEEEKKDMLKRIEYIANLTPEEEKTFINKKFQDHEIIHKKIEDNEKKLKVFDIIKDFNSYCIINAQGQWYLLQGFLFNKSPKIPITKEQANLIANVLKLYDGKDEKIHE